MRLIPTLLLSLLLVGTARAAGPKDGPDDATLAQAAKSVVQIISSGCSGEDPARAGSGFALGKDGLFVTDLHVVAGCTDYQVGYPSRPGRQGNELSATLVHVLKARDLALLKVDPPPPEIPGLQLASTPAQVSDKLQVIGYPLGLSVYDNAELSVSIANEDFPELKYSLDDPSRAELQSTGYPDLETDVVRVHGGLEPGDSGAPLIDWQGNVAAIGDGGLERGTVGIGWATQPKYVKELEDSPEKLSSVEAIGTASVDFAVAIPQTQSHAAVSTVKCGGLSLVPGRNVQAAKLVKTTDDPVRLRNLVVDLIGVPVEQLDSDKFTIWTEPTSGAGIALPKELHIQAGSDYCTVHTGAPNIDYLIALTQLPPDAASAEWEIEANRQEWLAVHRASVAANTNQLLDDRKHSVPRRFENGGIIIRKMLTGQSRDGRAVRVFTNDLSGRGAFVSIAVVNRDAKADPGQMSQAEKDAWVRGLLAVNLTALPPVSEDAAAAAQSSAAEDETSAMVWPGARVYPRVRCGEASLIPLPPPRRLADLAGSADLDAVLRRMADISAAAIANDLFDVWIQPLKGAVVLLPHGLAPAANQQACLAAAPNSPIGFALRVVKLAPEQPGSEPRRRTETAVQSFIRDFLPANGGRYRLQPAARFEGKVEPGGTIDGRLRVGTAPGGGRGLLYLVQLRRGENLTLFAMTDSDAKEPDALAPADRAALAQALAAVRLSTLLPPSGFLLDARQTDQATPAAAQTAAH